MRIYKSLPVLGSSRRNTHGPVTAVNALHLKQSTLLVILVRETDKAVAPALTRHGVCHDLGALARREAGLEEGHENVFVNFRTQVSNKDGVLGTTIIANIVVSFETSRTE